MFQKLGPNSVKSTDGFSVKRLSRFEIEYISNDKKMIVEVEPGDNLAIYSSSIESWLPPNNDKEITVDEKERILKNIIDALKFLGINYEIQ